MSRRDRLVRTLRFVGNQPGQSSTAPAPGDRTVVTVLLRNTTDLDAWDAALKAAGVARVDSWRGQRQRRWHPDEHTTVDVILRAAS